MRKIYKFLTGGLYLLLAVAFPASAFASTLSVSPTSGTVNKGCDFTVTINLDTQNSATDGTDAILLFNNTIFTAKTISSGTIYPDYPGNAVDNTNGKVTVSGLASVSQAFTGSGTLATVTFGVNQAAPTGAGTIKFDFDSNNLTKTTDSNVVERGTIKDTLLSVTDGNYTIGSGACTSTTPAAGTSGGTTLTSGTGTSQGATTVPGSTGIAKTLPDSALEGPALIFSILGGLLVVVGLVGLVLL